MEEIFNEPCQQYYKVFNLGRDDGYQYKSLSPFEFKNVLLDLAHKKAGHKGKILNAGRGNPNFFSTIPRYTFSLLQTLATNICVENSQHNIVGYMPKEKGIAKKLVHMIKNTPEGQTKDFLYNYIKLIKKISGLSADKVVHQLIISTIGCFYPNPPRIQPFIEPVLEAFMSKIVYKKNFKNKIKIFPTEGASASILYVFNSLKYNKLVVEGDSIGIFTPIFSPYLEVPALSNYNLKQICINADPESDTWDISDKELSKIADSKMKALFIVNPTNPTSLSLSKKTVKKISTIVKTKNPNLIVLADNVYAPFVDEFNTLFNILPYNTIGVYSFSKYFGVTGWRLGAIAINNKNIIDDKLLKSLPKSDLNSVNKRYSIVSTTPQNIPFVERLVLDSRQVAEGHTAGLSTPQQVMMTLFAMHDYMDKNRKYNKILKNILKKRIELLLEPIKYHVSSSPLESNYYIVIDILKVAYTLTEDQLFVNHLQKHKDPLEFLIILAKKYATVLLPAVGFAGPFWSIRVSVANLDTKYYKQIGLNIKKLVLEYHKKFKKQSL